MGRKTKIDWCDMKESLRDLMGDDFKQEFPWEVVDNGSNTQSNTQP